MEFDIKLETTKTIKRCTVAFNYLNFFISFLIYTISYPEPLKIKKKKRSLKNLVPQFITYYSFIKTLNKFMSFHLNMLSLYSSE